MNFVKLRIKSTDDAIAFNADNIVAIIAGPRGTEIHTSDGEYRVVAESVDQVLMCIPQ